MCFVSSFCHFCLHICIFSILFISICENTDRFVTAWGPGGTAVASWESPSGGGADMPVGASFAAGGTPSWEGYLHLW